MQIAGVGAFADVRGNHTLARVRIMTSHDHSITTSNLQLYM